MTAQLAIVGTGWRAQYFARLASRLSAQVEVIGVVGRTVESASRLTSEWGGTPYDSLSSMMLQGRPNFVVSAVPWAATPEVTRQLVELGVPVLCETPPAPDLDGLVRIWEDIGGRRLVQVAEQYPRMPTHAARLALARSGAIGEVTSVQVSSTHLYHAVALIREFLGVGFAPARVRAQSFTAPLVDPLNRAGWTRDPLPKPAATVIATLNFGSRMGLYDFTDNQWHNQLRARRIVIRGSAGEIIDDQVIRLLDDTTIVTTPLVRRQLGYDLDLDGFDTDHISMGDHMLYRNRFTGLRLNDDEISVCELLLAMACWCADEGPDPYPLAQGCQDHQLGLAIDEALATGEEIRTAPQPWCD